MAESTCWSFGGPRFGSQHPHGDLQASVTPVPGIWCPLLASEGTVHSHGPRYAGKTPIYTQTFWRHERPCPPQQAFFLQCLLLCMLRSEISIKYFSLVFLTFYYFMCMRVMSPCLSVYYVCAWCLWRPEHDLRFPGTRDTDDYEPPYGC